MLSSFDYTGYSLDGVRELTLSKNEVISTADWGREELLIGSEHTPYFICTRWFVHGDVALPPTGDIRIGLVTDGDGQMIYDEGALPLQRGDEVFLPWSVPGLRLKGNMTMVLCQPSYQK